MTPEPTAPPEPTATAAPAPTATPVPAAQPVGWTAKDQERLDLLASSSGWGPSEKDCIKNQLIAGGHIGTAILDAPWAQLNADCRTLAPKIAQNVAQATGSQATGQCVAAQLSHQEMDQILAGVTGLGPDDLNAFFRTLASTYPQCG